MWIRVLFLLAMAALATNSSAAETKYLYASKVPLEKAPGARVEPGTPPKYSEGDRINYYCTKGFLPIKLVKIEAEALSACSEHRLDAVGGDQIVVFYVQPRRTATCDGDAAEATAVVDEQVRKTVLQQGFKAVVKFIAEASGVTSAPAAPRQLELCQFKSEYELKYVRATATVTTAVKADAAATGVTTLITGPAEHWFFSGDAVLKGVKELKYDPDTKRVLQRDKPEQLYLGINYMQGDLYTSLRKADAGRFVYKLMLQPSRRPFDSFGVGIGYRIGSEIFQTDISKEPPGGFMVFVGSFWTKGDQVDAGGAVVSGKREQSWRVGVSYSLDSLFGWLK